MRQHDRPCRRGDALTHSCATKVSGSTRPLPFPVSEENCTWRIGIDSGLLLADNSRKPVTASMRGRYSAAQ